MMCDRQKECLACTNRSCMMAGIEDPKLGEECGVFGMYDMDGGDVASSIYYGLFSLQHRGQESCGIAVSRTDGEKRNSQMIKGMGLVNEVFDAEKLEQLHGDIGVGHVRYSTAGASIPENTQPLVLNYIKGTLMVAHNGNLVNAVDLRRELELMGAIFHTSIDSEVIAYLIARERLHVGTVEDAVKLAMQKIRGAYSLVVASPRKMIGARDPFGFHPLCIGKRDTFSHLKAVRWTQLVQNLYEMLHRERSLRSRRREYSQIAVWLLTNAQDVFLNIFILPDRIVISMGYVCIPLD